MNLQKRINQASINDNLVEQFKIAPSGNALGVQNSSFRISRFQGMEEAIEWYIENINEIGK